MDDHIRQPRNFVQQTVAARRDHFLRRNRRGGISKQTGNMIVVHQLIIAGTLECGDNFADFVLLLLSGIVSV
ncbi:hypothetical protein D3C87_1970380 [compost metagenome]